MAPFHNLVTYPESITDIITQITCIKTISTCTDLVYELYQEYTWCKIVLAPAMYYGLIPQIFTDISGMTFSHLCWDNSCKCETFFRAHSSSLHLLLVSSDCSVSNCLCFLLPSCCSTTKVNTSGVLIHHLGFHLTCGHASWTLASNIFTCPQSSCDVT